jgi:hypothetical protein
MTNRFNPPQCWPQPPAGWVPPVGWAPDPRWPAPPDGWIFWVDDDAPTLHAEAPTIPVDLQPNSGPPAVGTGGNVFAPASPSFIPAPAIPPSPYATSDISHGNLQAVLPAKITSPVTPTTSAVDRTQPKPGRKSRRPGSSPARSGSVKHWKRNIPMAAAAALVTTVGVIFVPKWLGPMSRGFSSRGT